MQNIEQIRKVAHIAPDLNSGIYDIELGIEDIKPMLDSTPVDQIRDNLILDRFGYLVYLNSDPDYPPFTMSDIKQVYKAAKVVFEQHPDSIMYFDPVSYLSDIGSPWGYECKTPEMWAICYGRRMLEDDECAINDSSDNAAKQVYEFCIEMIEIVGIPEEVLRENIAYICYENEELTAKVKNLLG